MYEQDLITKLRGVILVRTIEEFFKAEIMYRLINARKREKSSDLKPVQATKKIINTMRNTNIENLLQQETCWQVYSYQVPELQQQVDILLGDPEKVTEKELRDNVVELNHLFNAHSAPKWEALMWVLTDPCNINTSLVRTLAQDEEGRLVLSSNQEIESYSPRAVGSSLFHSESESESESESDREIDNDNCKFCNIL
jgi:hypothetical protein